MKFNNIIVIKKNLYIFFLLGSLIIFFFSTTKSNAKAFEVDNIEISEPFEINFDKNQIIDLGFKKGFSELISLIVNSEDQKKIDQIKLNEIKGMIESFSIKEEKFINETYYVKLGVLFNKKKVFNFLEKKNIFPSIPNKKKFLFIPILIDENKKDLLNFSNNSIYNKWNDFLKSYHLIEYILPQDDLEDINFIKKNFDIIEQYDFKDITKKYLLKDSIILLIFKNKNEIRVLSRITIKDSVTLKNQSFLNIDIKKEDQIEKIIYELKNIYEDYWKKNNQINTSIKLPLTLSINSKEYKKIKKLEKYFNNNDLVSDFHIIKFNNKNTFFKIIYNGSPKKFIIDINKKNIEIEITGDLWVVK